MPRIREIHAAAVDVPLTEPFAIAGGAPAVARNVFVRVIFNDPDNPDDRTGYGEAAPFEAVSGETQASTLAAIARVTPSLIGREAGDWRALRPLMPAEPAARCALEQALCDVSLGSGIHRLKTDITIPAGSVEHAVAAARRAAAAGFDTVKIKAGAAGWETDAARVRAIHAAEPALRLIVDANCGYDLREARAFLGALHEVQLELFEQPVPAAALDDLAALTADAAICADESVRGPADAKRVADLGVAAINVKLMKCGVADALEVIAIARAARIPCMIGGMIETPLSMSYSAALAAAEPGLFRYVDLDTPLFMPPGVVDAPLTYDGPNLTLRPGRPDAARWFP
ncbi:dipeptide epimerase [Dactylosporangium sp. NPDC048998]|uniref:dipeptide epimerase n=1 Tax=Dactylosporangium sp. NPDC048998 TaxID=3363976 RepID=UPI00371FFFA8